MNPSNDFPGLVPTPGFVKARTQECTEELAQQGLSTLPLCLLEDLIGVLDQPFAPVAPLEQPAAERGYWKALLELVATPRWRHCADRLRRGGESARAGGTRALLTGMLGLGAGPVNTRAPQRITQREKVVGDAIRVPSSLATLMSAVRFETGRDVRRIDLSTAGLYESSGGLELPESSLAHELLRELRRKVRGPRAGESLRPRGGCHGITRRGRGLENVCLAEAGPRPVFAAKMAIGELSYFRRVQGTMESPWLHLPIVLDGDRPDAPCGGCRFHARACALSLLLAHDFIWHVVEYARGMRFVAEVAVQGRPGSVRLPLSALPPVAVLANDQPFLTEVGPALPLFLRQWDAPRADRVRIPPVFTWPIAIRLAGKGQPRRGPGIAITLEPVKLRIAHAGSREQHAFDYSTAAVLEARRVIVEHLTRDLIHALAN